MDKKAQKLASYFDHTLLKAGATITEIKQLCSEAKEYGFASVCVNPQHVLLCSQELQNSPVNVCTVVGFPLGANKTQTKVFETTLAIREGAKEIDMVMNIGAAKEKRWDLVAEDIQGVVKAAGGLTVKVILETCYLTDEEIAEAVKRAVASGAAYVKTSTGFGSDGAQADQVQLMARIAGNKAKVKASGGIRTLDQVQAMIQAGASRIGASAGVAILKEFLGESNDNSSGGY